jgi:hypothetical protein
VRQLLYSWWNRKTLTGVCVSAGNRLFGDKDPFPLSLHTHTHAQTNKQTHTQTPTYMHEDRQTDQHLSLLSFSTPRSDLPARGPARASSAGLPLFLATLCLFSSSLALFLAPAIPLSPSLPLSRSLPRLRAPRAPLSSPSSSLLSFCPPVPPSLDSGQKQTDGARPGGPSGSTWRALRPIGSFLLPEVLRV